MFGCLQRFAQKSFSDFQAPFNSTNHKIKTSGLKKSTFLLNYWIKSWTCLGLSEFSEQVLRVRHCHEFDCITKAAFKAEYTTRPGDSVEGGAVNVAVNQQLITEHQVFAGRGRHFPRHLDTSVAQVCHHHVQGYFFPFLFHSARFLWSHRRVFGYDLVRPVNKRVIK